MFVLEPLGKFAIEVIPQKPFQDWLEKMESNSEEPLFSDYNNSDSSNSLYMVPAEYAGYLEEFLIEYFDVIFTNELGAWIIKDILWPENRTLNMFKEWFEIRTFDFCWDLGEEEDEMLLWNPN